MSLNILKEVAALQRLTVNISASAMPRFSGKRRETTTKHGWSAASFGGCRPMPKAVSANGPWRGPRNWPTPPTCGPRRPRNAAYGDGRLSPPGSVIVRPYKGRELRVKVLTDGFEFEGDVRKVARVAV